MSTFVYANNVNTTLAANITSPSQTSITLSSSANLPTLSAGEIFALTLNDAATGGVFEVVYVTAITGATLTVTRGQEGTTATTWLANDKAFGAVTAGELSGLAIAANPGATAIDTSSNAQTKAGALTVSGGITSTAGVAVGGALTGATTGSFSGGVSAGSLTSSGGVSAGGALTSATTGSFSGAVASQGAYLPPVYDATGASLGATTKIVTGLASIPSGNTAVVTLSGAAVFTGASTYQVTANTLNGSPGSFVQVQYNSGSSFNLVFGGAFGASSCSWTAIGY